jgi:1,4-dihydroxy-2-naphthoate octaprenyltransferase
MANPYGKRQPDGSFTLVLGIVLTVVGGGLLVQTATHVHVWRYLWRLWPVLLIVMGVKAILDYRAARAAFEEEQR